MSKSYKFRGDVNYSFNKKKKVANMKEHTDKNVDEVKEEGSKTSYKYTEWEEGGDFEKFDRKR